jgi:hypothetical protein
MDGVLEKGAENVSQQTGNSRAQIAEPHETGLPQPDNTETSEKIQSVHKDLSSPGPSSRSGTENEKMTVAKRHLSSSKEDTSCYSSTAKGMSAIRNYQNLSIQETGG